MDLNPVVLSIPIFFLLMAIELIYERITKKHTYRLNDAVTNISTGTLSQVSGVFQKVLKIGIYVLVYENLRIFDLPSNAWTFAAIWVLYDLGYYWEHRMAHTVSLFWGGHVVHHQSEDYNLSVALRQTSTGALWGFFFYLPIALLGFDPVQVVTAAGFNLLYQFWIHTEHINKMPRWFEAVLNTPSHHRVHHGRDPKYIDKNYAGVFIIWDKMFGTFKEEEERPNYGTTVPLKSWNPLFANFAHYIDLFGVVKQARTTKDKLKILFYKPGWLPDYLGGAYQLQNVPEDYKKYDTEMAAGMKAYLLFQFAILAGVTTLFLFMNENFTWYMIALLSLWIAWTTVMFGFFAEKEHAWVHGAEVLRLLLLPILLYLLLWSGFDVLPGWMPAVGAGLAVLSLIFYFQVSRRKNFEKFNLVDNNSITTNFTKK